MPLLRSKDLFDFEKSIAGEYVARYEWPWDALAGISQYIMQLGAGLPAERFDHPAEDVWIAKSAKLAPTAFTGGPLIIDEEAEVRHCAYIRGAAIVGKKAVVGNSTELKNVILFDGVQVPHYNYVGDSILGHRAHMGAGSITSNVKSGNGDVSIKAADEAMDTHRRKVGAMLGDFADVGCNSVLCPGTVLGRGTRVYPLSLVRGVVPPNSIFKGPGNIAPLQQR